MILGPPDSIDDATRAFCATIAPGEPFYVPVRPRPGGRVAYCFQNSTYQAVAEGGDPAWGWAIWRWPGRWFEAEHHAVWRTPEGEYVDVTPQAGDPPRVLFLPDPRAVYDPRTFRANPMAAEAGNGVAAEYIALVAQRNAIVRAYWRPCVDQLRLFSEQDRARLAPIEARMAALLEALRLSS